MRLRIVPQRERVEEVCAQAENRQRQGGGEAIDHLNQYNNNYGYIWRYASAYTLTHSYCRGHTECYGCYATFHV